MSDLVPLERRFTKLDKDRDTAEQAAIASLLGGRSATRWCDLADARCTVILADAGAGKTTELRERARDSRTLGSEAFFIRIEEIDLIVRGCVRGRRGGAF